MTTRISTERHPLDPSSDTDEAVRTQRLNKRYRRVIALRDLDLVVRTGEIYGLLGPNGAGKTTTLRLPSELSLYGDEPTTGLDSLAQRELNTYLCEYAAAGGTVLFSCTCCPKWSRSPTALELCSTAGSNSSTASTRSRRRRCASSISPSPSRSADIPGVRELQVHDTQVHCRVSGAVGELVRAAARLPLINVISHEPELQDIFLDYVQRNGVVR